MKISPSDKQKPTILVVFGATGDLMTKKITPALFNLFKRGELPQVFRVVGFARRDLSDKDFRGRAVEVLNKHHDLRRKKNTVKKFLASYSYEQGKFEVAGDYKNLAKTLKSIDRAYGICSNKLFYLAVPPQLYPEILNRLAAEGLTIPCGGKNEGWTRVIIEKPFGRNLKSAKGLDILLGKLFEEEQIYRIDHYLAKEMLQNILAFRFSNNLFETNWGNSIIERINIRLLESLGVEDRGGFYDGVGALRDVGQNHLLQMLALIAMDTPSALDAHGIRANREKTLSALKVPSREEIKRYTFRAQYNGYRTIKGVAMDSETETYFKVRAALSLPRWKGVEISMESGKRIGAALKEIEVIFKHPLPCFCPPNTKMHYRNKLVIHLEPKEGITLRFWSKKPGYKMELEERKFSFQFRKKENLSQYTEEYEKLLLDCISGDQTLFVSSKEIAAMWKFVDPIIDAWEKGFVPLGRYKPDSRLVTKEAEEAENRGFVGEN